MTALLQKRELAAFCAAALLAWTAGAVAAPLEFSRVAVDATWLAHLDVDAMRASPLARRFCQHATDSQQHLRQRLDDLRDRLGLDLAKDLHGITLYGKELREGQGVLLLEADFKVETILNRIAEAPDYKLLELDGRELHSWTHTRGGKQHPVHGAFFRPTLLVLSPNRDALIAALDVLDGRQASLKGKDSPLAAAPPHGAMLAVRAVALDRTALRFKSPLVTQSETFHLDAAEAEGELKIAATLGLKSSEAVEQIEAILRGMRAMAELRAGEEPEAAVLMRRLKTEMDGKTIRLDFSAPADDLWRLAIKMHETRQTEKQ